MPSFWQQSTYNVSTNFNHTPSHHYWSQNPQETRKEIHKGLFHTSLSLQTHPQPPPHQSPAQQQILLGHDYKIGCVPGINKKKECGGFYMQPRTSSPPQQPHQRNCCPPAPPGPIQTPNTRMPTPPSLQERQQLTLKIC